jgi:hypothetical protein
MPPGILKKRAKYASAMFIWLAILGGKKKVPSKKTALYHIQLLLHSCWTNNNVAAGYFPAI